MHDPNPVGWIVLIAIAVVAVILGRRQLESAPSESGEGEIVVRTYRASNQQAAARQLGRDAERLAARGYEPVSQSWAQGQWGCGAFLLALLLFVVLVGIVVFIYMLLVKPDGTLTVTFQRRAAPPRPAAAQPATPPPTPPVDHVASLRVLAEMRDAGLITPAEFEAKKADLLARI